MKKKKNRTENWNNDCVWALENNMIVWGNKCVRYYKLTTLWQDTTSSTQSSEKHTLEFEPGKHESTQHRWLRDYTTTPAITQVLASKKMI